MFETFQYLIMWDSSKYLDMFRYTNLLEESQKTETFKLDLSAETGKSMNWWENRANRNLILL